MDRFDWLELDPAEVETLPPRQRPFDGPSYYRAARLMREAGHFKAAADFYERAIGFSPHLYNAWIELVDTLVRGRRYAEADAKSEEALSRYRKVKGLYAARALAQCHAGDQIGALDSIAVCIDGGSAPWYARCVQSEILLRQSDANRPLVLEYLELAADAATKRWEPHFIAGWILLDGGYAVLAAGHFAESAHYNVRAPITWLCLGDCFRELRLYDQAMFYYQRVTELEPKHSVALERQKLVAGRGYGLMRLFRKEDLVRRWNDEYAKLSTKRELTVDDL